MVVNIVVAQNSDIGPRLCMMFFSHPQLSLLTKVKEKALPPKSKFHQMPEKSLESMENPGKAWEIPGKHGKSRESMGNPGKAWKIQGKHRKSWEILGKHGKSQEKL